MNAIDLNTNATISKPLGLKRWPSGWSSGALLIAAVISLPMLTVFSYFLQPSGENWQHLVDTVLANYVSNSLLLMTGVTFGTLFFGVSAAWLVSMFEFPGRRWFEWALLLPMAIPAYIIAYTYTGMLEFAGPLQTALRAWFGWSYGDYWFPEVRSLGGAILMLSLVLYPYVYLLSRAAFIQQSVCVLEVSRSLGCTPWKSFTRVAIPLARPAIIAGLSLVLMETLADYGTVEYFGIPTFTTGIFRTWFGLGDTAAAAQLAAVLMLFIFALVMLERWSRKRARFYHTSNSYNLLQRPTLTKFQGWLAFTVCCSPILLGFVIPTLQLSHWAWLTWDKMVDAHFLELAFNSFRLATYAALLALVLALVLGYGQRLNPSLPLRFGVRLAAMGYAIPGTVIAVGIMVPFGWLDNRIDSWMRSTFEISSGLLFSGTVFILLFAYCVRFLAVSLQSVEAGLAKMKPSMDEAARSLGYRPTSVLRKVHLPILRSSLLTAVILVFVDVMKELPATYIMRPFNFNTLAVRAFELAGDERLADSSTAALAIVVTGVIPVIILSRLMSSSRPGQMSSNEST